MKNYVLTALLLALFSVTAFSQQKTDNYYSHKGLFGEIAGTVPMEVNNIYSPFSLPARYWNGGEYKTIDPVKMDFNFVLESYFWSVLSNARAYEEDTLGIYGTVEQQVLAGYCVFGINNSSLTNAIGYSDSKEDRIVKDELYSVYKTHSKHEKLYKLLKPVIKIVYYSLSSFSPKNEGLIADLTDYVIDYLRSFNLSAEKKHYNSNPRGFTSNNRDGSYSPYRKGAAWCYRRISMGHMSSSYLLKWANRLKKEIIEEEDATLRFTAEMMVTYEAKYKKLNYSSWESNNALEWKVRGLELDLERAEKNATEAANVLSNEKLKEKDHTINSMYWELSKRKRRKYRNN